MTVVALIYHAVEDGPGSLCVDERLFESHLDLLGDAGVVTLTVSQLADAVRTGELPDPAVAITFDDGMKSVVRRAVPLLRERGMSATIFCVAAHLGGRSDWPTQPPALRGFALASAAELAAAAGERLEVGSHGLEHVPLHAADPATLRRELAVSRARLEEQIGVDVGSFAFPYAAVPARAERELASAGYRAACAGGLALIDARANPFALPRVDAHYVRRPALLRRLVGGSLPFYLGLRRVGARARRVVVQDYAEPAGA